MTELEPGVPWCSYLRADPLGSLDVLAELCMNEHARAIYLIYLIEWNIAWLSSSPPAQLRAMVFTDVLAGVV